MLGSTTSAQKHLAFTLGALPPPEWRCSFRLIHTGEEQETDKFASSLHSNKMHVYHVHSFLGSPKLEPYTGGGKLERKRLSS